MKPVTELPNHNDIHLFKHGIKPLWEVKPNESFSDYFANLLMSFRMKQINAEVGGFYVSEKELLLVVGKIWCWQFWENSLL